MMRLSWKRLLVVVLTPILVTTLGGCSVGSLVGAPTPEPWAPPPTATAIPATEEPVSAVTPTPSELATVAVERGDLPDVLVMSGQVAPVLEREMAFRQDGVLRTLTVEPGMPVSSGQLLAELDLGTLREELVEARTVAEQDAVAINRASESAQLNVQAATIALEAAQSNLSEIKTPPSPADIAEARAAVAQAEANLARTRNDSSAVKTRAEQVLNDALANLQNLQAQYGDVQNQLQRKPSNELRSRAAELEGQLREAESTVALARIDRDTAVGNEIAAVQGGEADVALAKANLEQLLAGPDPFAVAEAERAVRLAQVDLQEARQAARPDPEMAKRLAASQLAVKQIESQIENRRIYAPFEGMITAVDGLAGFPVQAEVPVIRLMDNSGLQVVVSGLTPEQLDRLPPETPVNLRFGELEVPGVVKRAAQGAALGGTPLLRVAYTAPDLELAIGSPAEVIADFGLRKDVLWLPVEALRRDTSSYVLLLDGDEERRAEVEIGISADGRVEIVAGLNEQDLVVLP